MPLLSAPTAGLHRRFGLKGAIRAIADAGFDAYDLTLCTPPPKSCLPFWGDDYAERAKEIRAYADEIGIVCNQAHAPFPTSTGNEREDEEIFSLIVRAMEVASILGAKTIVVHPKHHLPYLKNIEELKRINIAFYRRLIPYCERFGIRVAAENMWQNDTANPKKIIDSTCSRGKEFREYLDEIGSPWIVACLDWGHLSVVGEDPADAIRALGKTHLQAMHVHDNDSFRDDHTVPFLGKQDEEDIADLLAEIGYEGDLTFEANNFVSKMPDPLVPSALRFLHGVGRYLLARIERQTESVTE